MFQTYILRSLKNGRYYVGSTKDIENRIWEHNSGEAKSTKGLIPWKIVYTEIFETLSEARKREYNIKAQKSKVFIEQLISKSGRGSVG